MHTLVKYYDRMCTRSTPYGINAGISQGKLGNDTNVVLNKSSHYQKHVRADFKWVCEVIKIIEVDKRERRLLKVKASPICFSRGDRLYNPYLSVYNESNVEEYSAISIRLTKAVSKVLEYCSDFVVISDLEQFLASIYKDVEGERINQLIDDLITNEFLYTNLRPSISGKIDPLKHVFSVCCEAGIKNSLLDKIKHIINLIDEYERYELGEGIDKYLEIINCMEQISKTKSYLQVDLSKPTLINHIDRKIFKELEECITLLMSLADPNNGIDVEQLENNFVEKYGYFVDVPLLEYFHENCGNEHADYVYNTRSDKINYLEKLLDFHMQKNEKVINLTEGELEKLASEFPNANTSNGSHSFDIFLELIKTEKNQYNLVLSEAGTTNAGQVFGRFFKYMNAKILDEIYDVSLPKFDQVVYAEINEYPSVSRLGNVCLNQNNLQYSISFSAFNNSKVELPVSDLYIGMDKKTNHFYIKSKKLNKYVVVKETNVLNEHYLSDISKFLHRIFRLGQRNLYQILSNLRLNNTIYTPRICFKNIILKPATWNVEERDIRFFSGQENWNDTCCVDFLKYYNVPDNFYLQEYDRKLFINILNPTLKDILIKTLKEKKRVVIVEILHDLKTCLVKDVLEKNYLNEIVLSVYPTNWLDNIFPAFETLKDKKTEKILIGENGWVYLKLYGCTGREEELIGYYIKTFIDILYKNGDLNKHFFIRYKDPDLHVRLRLKFVGEVPFNQINDWLKILIENGLINKVVYEPYEQECNRYGGPNVISSAEEVFCADSIAIEKIMSLSNNKTLKVSDEFIGIVDVLNVLETFGMNRSEQLEYLNSKVQIKKYLSEFRKQRLDIMRISSMDLHLFNSAENQILNILRERTNSIKAYANNLLEETKYGDVLNDISDIISSVIHMSCNRFKANINWEQKILTLTRHGINSIIQKEKHIK